MLFGKKRKEKLHKGEMILAKGIYLKNPVMDNGNILANCFLRSMIVFLLAFGCVGSFLSSFSISYNYVLVMVCYLILALYFSFIYSTSKLLYRDIGYILFFMVFVAAIAMFHSYANSGLYSIVNIILSNAQTFFDLSGVRQYDVLIANEYLTIGILAVFIGVVLIILLNIWLSSSMSVFWTVFLTFPILLIPLYMKLIPDLFYIICLLVGYLLVMIFKSNGHFVTFSWNTAFRIRKKNKLDYTQDAKVFFHTLLFTAVLGICMVTATSVIFPKAAFEASFKKDTLREETADTIGNFLLLGFFGMYNRYDNTGGLAEGQLGGVANVRPDYQTDLIVSYTPYSAEAVYLKGYTGALYDQNQWYTLYDVTGFEDKPDISIFMDESMKSEAFDLMQDWMSQEPYSARGEMQIKNVGAKPDYMYIPYYTLLENYDFSATDFMFSKWGIPLWQSKVYEYYPKQEWDSELFRQQPEDMYLTNVNEIYLDVPENNQKVIETECEKIGLTKDMSVGEIVTEVQNYFDENIPYTLKPGALPQDEDFVNFFLTKNRKGYCAHFASAATLIFRQMKIPARYVEGYAFSMETALASDENKELKYDDYFSGYASFGRSTVLDVEVNDSMAHAWVEIYVDGFGWIPIEVTPGSNEVLEEDDFWSAFRNMLGNADFRNPGGNNTNFGSLQLENYKWLIFIFLGIIGCIFVIRMLIIFLRKLLRFLSYHQKNKREALVLYYADVCDMLRIVDGTFDACKSHKEQLLYMKEHGMLQEDVSTLSQQLELITYSEYDVGESEIKRIISVLKNVKKAIWNQVSFGKRVALWKR
ncbi:MAG: transglutaminase domain-containing protein [Lachnospiraceae bacterium]